MRYCKKPVVVEAVQWDGTETGTTAVQAFVGRMENMDGDVSGERFYPATLRYDDLDDVDGSEINEPARIWPNDDDSGARLWVEANKAWLPIEPGEWVIKDARGAYPCKADIFKATYEAAGVAP